MIIQVFGGLGTVMLDQVRFMMSWWISKHRFELTPDAGLLAARHRISGEDGRSRLPDGRRRLVRRAFDFFFYHGPCLSRIGQQ